MLKEGRGRGFEYLPPISRYRSCATVSHAKPDLWWIVPLLLNLLLCYWVVFFAKDPLISLASCLPPFAPYTLLKPCVLTFSSKPIADVYQQATGAVSNSWKKLWSAKCSDLVHCCISISVSKLNVLDWRFCNKMFWVIRVNFLNRYGLIISWLLFVDAVVTELSFFCWWLCGYK